MSEVLENDYKAILDSCIEWEAFRNKSILITGATGLIGSLVIKSLLYVSDKLSLNIQILAVARNAAKAKELFESNENITFVFHDFASGNTLDVSEKVDYIIHTASMTASKDFLQYPVENAKTSLQGTINILDLAVSNKAEGVVYLSSMEAYGQMNVEDHLVAEGELGKIDMSSVRSCYPEAKRMCECICNAYAVQYGLHVVSARLAQTFGPGIGKNENRVFAQFARSVIEHKDIVLHTKGLSEGNYVYTTDAVVAILLLLTKGNNGEAYNVVNQENHMCIKDMAEMIATDIADGVIKVVFDIPENLLSTGYAPDTKMHLSSEKMNSLGWEARVTLLDMYKRTIAYMKEEWYGLQAE